MAITAESLSGITTAVTGNVGVLLPVGIGLMTLFISISVIPKVIYRFL